MKFSAVSLLAFAAMAVAQTAGFDPITVPTQDQILKAGSSFEIVWEPSAQTGTVTITLLQGASPSTLQLGPVVAAGIDNQVGKFVWNPVPAAQFATYGFKLSLDSNPDTFQYSFPFHIQDAAASSSASASSSSTAVSSPSTAASSPSTAVSSPSTSVSSPSAASTSAKDTSAVNYPTFTPVSYPTTFSVATSPRSTYVPSITPFSTSSVPTTTPCSTESVVTNPHSVPTYQPTYPASPNSTWVQPTGTGYSTTPAKPFATGAATRFGTNSFAAIACLLALAI